MMARMAVPRRDWTGGNRAEDSNAGRPVTDEDDLWPDGDNDADTRDQITVARVKSAKVATVRGARRRQ